MEECCKSEELKVDHRQKGQVRILQIVLLINFVMFFVELIYSFLAHSTSLLADSLDMLGDAFVYGFSIYVIGRGLCWEKAASNLKGIIMLVFGLGVIGEAFRRFMISSFPEPLSMGVVSLIALAANFACAFLLLRYRYDDMNMRSAWLCSRNDVLANIGVIMAAAGVAVFDSKIPDLLVGIIIACLVLQSAWHLLNSSGKPNRINHGAYL